MGKRCLILLILIAAGLLMSMKPLTEKELAGISGQSGVSFFVDITMNIHADTIAWGDPDGLGPHNIWGVQSSGGYMDATGLTAIGLSLQSSRGSLSFWPSPETINIRDGRPYYRENMETGQR